MKKMAELMEDLGFRPEGSDEVKKAFIKNLIKQTHISEFARLKSKQEEIKKAKETSNQTDPDAFEQISLFDQKVSS